MEDLVTPSTTPTLSFPPTLSPAPTLSSPSSLSFRSAAEESASAFAPALTPTPHPTLWQNKRVLITGHTGFKGGWLTLWLKHLGAEICGYALDPATTPALFTTVRLHEALTHDIRANLNDTAALEQTLHDFAPEVIFHLAAQPLVRASYADPIGTYETNIMGTARLLDCVRRTPSVRAVVVITTDKCYDNREWLWPYRESDPLGGYDPYSSSKACAELVAAAFRHSYFPVAHLAEHRIALATARAGNVIGGGDWAQDRLIPDLVRGFLTDAPVTIRNPHAVRPWQHVLEPLAGYLRLAEHLLTPDAARYATAFNFGPAEDDAAPVHALADRMRHTWGGSATWLPGTEATLHEAGQLRLDSSRARAELSWRPRLHVTEAVDWLVAWYKAHAAGEDMQAFTLAQITRYEALP